MTDLFFTIHTKTETLTALFATNAINELNNTTRGETATFTFKFLEGGESSTLIVESGETYTVNSGDTEIYSYVNVKEDGTVNVEEGGTLNTTGGDNRESLQQYADHAGDFTSVTTLNNVEKFREQLPSTASVDSILLGIEPSQDLQESGIVGKWGLVTAGSDERNSALTNNQYQIEIRIVAEYSEFADHSAVENSRLV